MYPTDVPHLHGFYTFSVPHLKIIVPHLKLERLATLGEDEDEDVRVTLSQYSTFLNLCATYFLAGLIATMITDSFMTFFNFSV